MKLRVIHETDMNPQKATVMATSPFNAEIDDRKVTDYAGNKIYENGQLKRVLVDGGYIEDSIYHFYLKDHLGNNRVVVNQNDSIVQRNHYYPFGMEFADNSGDDQPYKYNGKELDKMHGLNMYDYSARQTMPDAGNRFTSVDPHAENYYNISPYVYAANNPIRVIDPTGMDTTHVDLKGNVQLNLKGGEDMIVVDQDLPEVVIEAERIYPAPNYVGISVTGSAVWGVGLVGEVSIGILPKDGIVANLDISFAVGADVSYSVNGKQGKYTGSSTPTGESLEGNTEGWNAGVGSVNFGKSYDVFTSQGRNDSGRQVMTTHVGENWNFTSLGYTIGSKTFAGAHKKVIGYTTPPLYLYKK